MRGIPDGWDEGDWREVSSIAEIQARQLCIIAEISQLPQPTLHELNVKVLDVLRVSTLSSCLFVMPFLDENMAEGHY